MRELKVIPGIDFPIDAVTQKFAWLGRSGSGKTHGCKRFVEQMLYANAQVIVLDSVGVWFGLRQGPKGFPVPVLGGIYGDIPLEPGSGALVAEALVGHNSSAVLDVSQMSDAAKARFAAAFGQRLFELKKMKPGAMHVVLDEGQDIVPQHPEANENMMLHEWVRIAKQGRAFGIGLSIVSQRPQEISKRALNQAECVVAFQLTGPHERKALEYWLADKGMDTKVSDELPKLEIGVPFVWSPQWLKVSKVTARVLPIDSADTSQTPKVGDAPRSAAALKPIDLGALRVSMAQHIELVKENDPKELKAEVKRLREQLAAQQPAAAVAPYDESHANTLRVLFETLDVDRLEKLRQVVRDLTTASKSLEVLGGVITQQNLNGEFEKFLEKLRKGQVPSTDVSVRSNSRKAKVAFEPLVVKATPGNQKVALQTGPLAVLVAAYHYGDRGISTPALRLETGYATRSITNYVVILRGHADGPLVERRGNRLHVTDAGKAHVPSGTKAYPKGKALVKHLIDNLPEGESQILRLVFSSHPNPASYETFSSHTKYAPRSITNYVTSLVGRGAVKRQGRALVIHPEVLS